MSFLKRLLSSQPNEFRIRPAIEDQKLPVTDYSKAREHALKQLGDRYLLAKPVPKKPTSSTAPI